MSGARHQGSSLVAVTRSKLAWLLRGQWKNLDATEGVACSPALYDGGFVDKDDPTMRIERTVTLKEVKDGRLVIDVVDKFDQQGQSDLGEVFQREPKPCARAGCRASC